MMPMTLDYKELGIECPFVAEGETEQVILDLFVPHIQRDHTGDWFEILEIYQVARAVLREKAA